MYSFDNSLSKIFSKAIKFSLVINISKSSSHGINPLCLTAPNILPAVNTQSIPLFSKTGAISFIILSNCSCILTSTSSEIFTTSSVYFAVFKICCIPINATVFLRFHDNGYPQISIWSHSTLLPHIF